MGSTKVGKKLDGISEQKAVRKTKRKANGKEKQKNEEPEELLNDNVEEDVKPMISEKKTNEGGKGDSQQDEYEYDSSDEEDLRNTIGNIPIKWYDDEEHIGYDKTGNKIAKPKKKGEIDTFLEKMEDPDYWRKVFDRQTGTDVTLTDEQVERIKNVSSGKYPQIGYNPYEPFLDLYSSEKMIHPIDNIPEPKSRFVPSKQEMQKVSKLVHAIKMGWLKPPQKKEEPKPYDLWASEDESSNLTKSQIARMRVHMPAPKMPLPVHNESYNPPEEYLLDEEEKKKWKEAEPEDRSANYIPQKFDSYRRVPQYKEFLSERYDRCLDLYLAPRKIKNKLQVTDPSQLLPDLPNPNDLKPFPTTLAFYMRGHSGQVRSISMEPEKGELMASGGADGTVKLWMVDTGRCVKTFKMEGPVTSVAFCPNAELTLLAVSCEGHQIALLNTGCGDKLLVANTEKFLKELPIGEVESQVDWRRNRERVILKMPNEVRKVVWHQKGDYFASVAIADIASSVYIHQLSKAKSQCPFRKRKGHVQTVGFHPIKPHLFVATKVSIRYYDLARCILLKKCSPGTAHVGAIAYDHTGDNLFVGGLDRKFSWLDLQLSNKPWKKFRHHRSAIRGVAFHKRYPLLATVSDDGSAMIYYVRIYTDSSRDNEIYPVKRLYPHQVADDLSVLDVAWHPTQPWLLTAGANGTVALFSS